MELQTCLGDTMNLIQLLTGNGVSREQVLDDGTVTHLESRSLLTLVVVRRVCPVNSGRPIPLALHPLACRYAMN